MTYAAVPIATFRELVEPLVGMDVTRPWRGYGSAMFLELGALTDGGSARHPFLSGERSISIEWDWRVERDTTVLFGSSNSGPGIERGLADLQGAVVESLSIDGRVPELTVRFVDGRVLRSLVMVTGEPEWSIRLSDGRYVHACGGRLLVGDGDGETGGLSCEEAAAFAHAERTSRRWGVPVAEPVGGSCRACVFCVPIDGEGALTDFGVCTSAASVFDGRAVPCAGGCPAFTAVG